MSPVYTADDVTQVRADEVVRGDLLAMGRAQHLGGYTAVRVGLSGPTVWLAEPGHYPVLVVRGGGS